jgi:hypothetical protein
MQAARRTPPVGKLVRVHTQQAPLQQGGQQKRQQVPSTLMRVPRPSCQEGVREFGRSQEGACEDRAGLRDHILSCCGELSIDVMNTPINLHFNLDTKDTLPEQDVSYSIINEVSRGLTGVDHESIGKLHRLGTSGTKFAGNDHLATLCTRLHDEAEDTVACPGHLISNSSDMMVAARTCGQQDHQGACISNSHIEQWQKDHGIALSRRKAQGSFRGT